MAQADNSRQRTAPHLRAEVQEHIATLEALTFTAGGATGPEVEALRDAVVDALSKAFGQPSS